MLPILALGVCIIFVSLFLWRTSKSNEGKSRSLWIPTIWTLINLSRPVGRWLSGTQTYETEISVGMSSIWDQVVLLSLIFLAIVVLFRRKISWSSVLKKNRWLLMLLIYMALSSLWSNYPMVSFKRWIKPAGEVLCAMVIVHERKPLRALELILRRAAYVLIPFSYLLINYFPALGVSYGRYSGSRMATGVCMQKNGLGLLCAIIILFFIWDFLRKKHQGFSNYNIIDICGDIIVFLLAAYLLFGIGTDSYSATAIAVTLIGLLAIIFISRHRAQPKKITPFFLVLIIPLIIIVAVIGAVLNQSPLSIFTNLLGRDTTLTGRVDIWAEIFKIVPRFTLLGTGFGGFWGLPYTYLRIGYMSGHNGYLDIYVELGLVGLILIFVFLFSLWKNLNKLAEKSFDWGALGLTYLLISFPYNYSESDFLNTTSPLWVVLIFFSLASSVEIESCESETKHSYLLKHRQSSALSSKTPGN